MVRGLINFRMVVSECGYGQMNHWCCVLCVHERGLIGDSLIVSIGILVDSVSVCVEELVVG